MTRFILSNKAKEDLLDIGRYTLKCWGKEQRNKYLTLIDKNFYELAAHPQRGMSCSFILEGYRKYAVGSHVIYYRQKTGKSIEIIRILHKRMDVEKQLLATEDNGESE